MLRHPSGVARAAIGIAIATLSLGQAAQAQENAEKTLRQVVVVDQREAQVERKESYLQKIVIAEEEVERFGDVSVGDILKRLTGISFTGPAGVTKDVRMRGLEKGYTQFMINGEPVNSATKERQMQVDRLPADMIERIEIIRAPSAEYDAGNIGGLINIVFKSKVEEVTRTRVAAGKNGKYDIGDAIVQTSKRVGNADIVLAASYTVAAEDVSEDKATYNATTGALTATENKPKPATKTELLFTPRVTWHFGEDRLTFDPYISKGTEDKKEDKLKTGPNVAIVTEREDKEENKRDQVLRLGGRYDAKREWGDWHAKLAFQETRADKDVLTNVYKYDAFGVYTGRERKTEDETIVDVYKQVGFGVVVPVAGWHLVRAGVEFRDGDYQSKKPKTKQTFNAADVPGAITNDSGQRDKFDISEKKTIVYLQDELSLAKNHWLTPGVRYERTARSTSGADKNGIAFNDDSQVSSTNPSLHYRWAIDKNLNFRASVTKTVKLPKFDQLNPTLDTSKNGLTSANAYTGGNVDLKPEEALGYEAGFEKSFAGNRGMVGINYYERRIKDYIENRTNQEVIAGSTFWVKRPYNVGEAHIHGVELDWRFPLYEKAGHVLNLVGNHSEMRGTIDSPSKGRIDVKEMPPRVSNLGIDYKHRPSGMFGGFSANYVPKFTTQSTNDDDVSEIKTWGARTALDVYVGKIFSPLAEVRLIGRNLLKVEKKEETLKGTTLERKVEYSKPTIMLTFESRF
ncbi:TonB-dependent receptor plug domain-containing protein [Azonexus hydrophilus]|uniref:TonB-dependent receptor plug domain-containing protein n=1 Tax=Azonexus hydrophilus TaxID=418702 RepID=UPI00248FE2BC|nr:TonB-dependent receptor [Azonexus hydrophilus]